MATGIIGLQIALLFAASANLAYYLATYMDSEEKTSELPDGTMGNNRDWCATQDEVCDCDKCFNIVVRGNWLYLVSAQGPVQFIRLCRATCLPPRERLDQIWRIYASWNLVTGLLFFVFGTVLLSDEPHLISRTIAFALFLIFIGVVDGWPNFRVKAQAYLASQGETRDMAAMAIYFFDGGGDRTGAGRLVTLWSGRSRLCRRLG